MGECQSRIASRKKRMPVVARGPIWSGGVAASKWHDFLLAAAADLPTVPVNLAIYSVPLNNEDLIAVCCLTLRSHLLDANLALFSAVSTSGIEVS